MLLNLDAFRKTPLVREPFDFLIVRGFLRPDAREALDAAFPRIVQAGSFPVDELRYGAAFGSLLAELRGSDLQTTLSDKFGIDLSARPTMVTVRGRCRKKDGRIHTDTTTKIISVLVYMNHGWQGDAGCLRLLRREDDLEDVVAEVPQEWGTLVAFRRSANSFHGHKPFEGERRVIQLNWVTEQRVVDSELARHRMTARLKRFVPWLGGY